VTSEQVRRVFQRMVRPAAALVVVALVCGATLRADEEAARLLIAQHDEVQAFSFDPQTGKGNGFQTGTTTGLIIGTSYVEFHFTFVGPPGPDGTFPFVFSNKAIITDMDGDQLVFDNNGTGKFHAGVPGDPFAGSGGPLTGTYVLKSGTGKFATWKVGSTYDYRAIATNPPNGALGTVHVQVTFHDHDPK